MSGPKSKASSTKEGGASKPTVRPAVGTNTAQSSRVGISPKSTQQRSCQGDSNADIKAAVKLPPKVYRVVRMQHKLHSVFLGKHGQSVRNACELTGCQLRCDDGGGSVDEYFKIRLCGSREAVDEVCACIDEFLAGTKQCASRPRGAPHKRKAIDSGEHGCASFSGENPKRPRPTKVGGNVGRLLREDRKPAVAPGSALHAKPTTATSGVAAFAAVPRSVPAPASAYVGMQNMQERSAPGPSRVGAQAYQPRLMYAGGTLETRRVTEKYGETSWCSKQHGSDKSMRAPRPARS